MSGPRVVGIAGPSGGGKSLLARSLAGRVSGLRPALLPLDAYYRDLGHLDHARRAAANFDHPDALDWPLLLAHLRELAGGGRVQRPVYDFAEHARGPGTVPTGPAGLVIVEGLHALAPSLRPRLHLAVWLELDLEACLARRLARDLSTRGRSERSVREQYRDTVLPMFRAHVLPTRRHADLVLPGDAPLDDNLERLERLLLAPTPEPGTGPEKIP